MTVSGVMIIGSRGEALCSFTCVYSYTNILSDTLYLRNLTAIHQKTCVISRQSHA